MTPLVTYLELSPVTPTQARRLVRLSGRSFIPVAWLARLPLAMGQIATLLLVADALDSLALGGLAAGAIAVGTAVGAPVGGLVADRIGQRPVLLVSGPVHAAGLVALVLLVDSGASTVALVACAALAGLFAPQVGPLARVRWVAMTRGRRDGEADLSTAFAYEGAGDEASFVAGPAIVGLLAAGLSPAAGPLLAAALAVVFVTAFALHPTARLVPGTPKHLAAPRTGSRLALPGGFATGVLLVAAVLLGSVFGGTQAGITALAAELGNPGAAGLVYAAIGVGSAVAGLATAAIPVSFGLDRRLTLFAGLLFVLAAPLLVVGSLLGATLAVLALGVAVAPYIITVYGLAERAAPVERGATVMSLVASAIVIGYAAGSASAGALADASGYSAALAVPVAAGALALALSLLARRTTRRLVERERPLTQWPTADNARVLEPAGAGV